MIPLKLVIIKNEDTVINNGLLRNRQTNIISTLNRYFAIDQKLS